MIEDARYKAITKVGRYSSTIALFVKFTFASWGRKREISLCKREFAFKLGENRGGIRYTLGSLSVEKTNVERRGVRDKLREDRAVKPS